MERLKLISISVLLFILGCFLLLKTNAPAWACWLSIIFFGGGAIFLIGIYVYELITGRKLGYGKMPIFELKDGRNCEVKYSDLKISLTKKNTTSVICEMNWNDIYEIFVAAAENNNNKRVSWTLHNKKKESIELPWNAEGAEALPVEIKKRPNVFKQTGDYEIKSYFQGFKIVWEKA